jgi:L-threonylcarbamoyladenylate synthase
VIVYPTSTLYGLGGDAMNPDCAARIRRIKGTRDAPFLLLAADTDAAFSLASDVPAAARSLAAAFWPGAVTMVLPARAELPADVAGPGGTVAVRVDPHPFCVALCRSLGGPILSTSANRSGQPAPSVADEIDPYVVGASDLLVVDNEPLTGTPSTLVGFIDGDVRILRAGAVPETSIRAALAAARRIDQ